MATYYCKWIVGDTDIIGNVNTACYGITVIATLLLGKVMHLLEKKQWCILGACFIIAGSLILLLNPTSVPLVTFGGLLRGIGMTPILGMIFTMIADAIEYGQWKNRSSYSWCDPVSNYFRTEVWTGYWFCSDRFHYGVYRI